MTILWCNNMPDTQLITHKWGVFTCIYCLVLVIHPTEYLSWLSYANVILGTPSIDCVQVPFRHSSAARRNVRVRFLPAVADVYHGKCTIVYQWYKLVLYSRWCPSSESIHWWITSLHRVFHGHDINLGNHPRTISWRFLKDHNNEQFFPWITSLPKGY